MTSEQEDPWDRIWQIVRDIHQSIDRIEANQARIEDKIQNLYEEEGPNDLMEDTSPESYDLPDI